MATAHHMLFGSGGAFPSGHRSQPSPVRATYSFCPTGFVSLRRICAARFSADGGFSATPHSLKRNQSHNMRTPASACGAFIGRRSTSSHCQGALVHESETAGGLKSASSEALSTKNIKSIKIKAKSKDAERAKGKECGVLRKKT